MDGRKNIQIDGFKNLHIDGLKNLKVGGFENLQIFRISKLSLVKKRGNNIVMKIRISVMVFNAIYNNISVISWRMMIRK